MHDVEKQLKQFLQQSAYMTQGAIVTDLDGTVLQEEEGKARIAVPVEAALNELYGLGRPVILNTLRFPLNVIRTLGQEWHRLAREQPIPLVSMNGSQIGFVKASDHKGLVFEELAAFPLAPSEIEEILAGYPNPKGTLIKFILPLGRCRNKGMRELYKMNITQASLFPDLDGLARSLAFELEFHWAYDPKQKRKSPQ